MERDQRPKQNRKPTDCGMPWEYPSNRDDYPRRRDTRSHRARVRNEVERRINNRKYVYAQYHILLPFCTRHPDAPRRAHTLTDVDNEAASQWHRREVGMPDHHAPLTSRRLGKEVVGGYDR